MKHKLLLVLCLLFSNPVSSEAIECYYYPDGPEKGIIEPDCLTLAKNGLNKITGGDALITKMVASKASYNENGLSFLVSKEGMFYFNRSGMARRALTYDNGPDYFSEGLARTINDKKIGYFNEKLKIKIKPEYDFGFPFKNGKAIVCNGCVRQKIAEHSTIVDGKWGIIDAIGNIIVPIVNSSEEIQELVK